MYTGVLCLIQCNTNMYSASTNSWEHLNDKSMQFVAPLCYSTLLCEDVVEKEEMELEVFHFQTKNKTTMLKGVRAMKAKAEVAFGGDSSIHFYYKNN